jgi:YbbR domain-containing protein
MSPADVVAVLDLHTARPGRRLFQLTPEQVRVPFGVQVVQVSPTTVAMVFENSAIRQVPVVPSVEGNPAPGYIVGKITSDPEKVEVTGPESAVERVTEAITEPISVTGARDSVSDTVTVGFLDPSLRLRSSHVAAVRVQIIPGPVERTVRDRPIHLRNLAPNLEAQATPSSVDVVLRGTRQSVNRVQSDQVTAFVNLEGLGPGDYPADVHADVDASQEAGVERSNPGTVQIRISSARR